MSYHERSHYNELFLDILRNLNRAQREAVEHIEGPVLVVAGPGTGKTHILAARIGHILMQTDAQAGNILCLTFTEAGVQAMRERLVQLIGPEAHRVHVHTFHSFCNNVIRDNLERFGRSDLQLLSDLERVELIRGLLDQLPNDHPLVFNRANIFFYEKHLAELFYRMKTEAWTPAYVGQQIDAYLESLPTREAYTYKSTREGLYRKGDLKGHLIAAEQEKMEKLRAGAALYDRYQEAMTAAGRYDFDDMILWVIRAFEADEYLLRTYQERYLYVLVDEFQDTNGSQNQVLHQLISYWENPNLFIVGDDDQSIFEFQGARLKNITDFYEQYRKHIRVVVLTDNYRSSQHILDAAGSIIRENQRRIIHSLQELGLQKVLVAANDQVAGSAIHPAIRAYPNRTAEAADLLARIRQLQSEGVPLREIAVIYARHQQAVTINRLLEKSGIPCVMRRRADILESLPVRQLHFLLGYLSEEFAKPHSGEYRLFELLHFACWNLPASDLVAIGAALALETEEHHWLDRLTDAAYLDALRLAEPARLRDAVALLCQLVQDVANYSVPAFVERVLNRSGMLAAAMHAPDSEYRLQLFSTFLDFTMAEAEKDPGFRLSRLLEILDNMAETRIPLPVQKTLQTGEGVNLMTAHASKGLEFRQVFMLDCVEDYWGVRHAGSALYRFSYPDTLTFSGEEDAIEARRRLFYVAMTRAREFLSISYSLSDNAGQPLERVRFIDELSAATGLPATPVEVPREQLIGAQGLQLRELATPETTLPAPEALKALLQGFTLTISGLNTYLRCPLSFYYENLLRLPAVQSEAAVYGTVMHQSLRWLFDQVRTSPGRAFPEADRLQDQFERDLRRRSGVFGQRAFERYLQRGKDHLRGYYLQHIGSAHINVRTEVPVRNVEVEGVPVSGFLDKVELYDDGTAIIVDYKTGKSDKGKLRAPGTRSPYGGEFWRQLVFYKLLYEARNAPPTPVTAGIISLLEPDRQGNFENHTIVFRPEDELLLRGWIRDVYDRIQRLEFTVGCGKADCHWCQFVRGLETPDSFASPETEALDDF